MNLKRRERDIQKSILDYLKLRQDVEVLRLNAGAVVVESGRQIGKTKARKIQLAPAGWPDIVGVLGPYGWFLGIEVKGPKGKCTELQLEKLARIEALGGCAIIAHDLADVQSGLEEFLNSSLTRE